LKTILTCFMQVHIPVHGFGIGKNRTIGAEDGCDEDRENKNGNQDFNERKPTIGLYAKYFFFICLSNESVSSEAVSHFIIKRYGDIYFFEIVGDISKNL